MSNNEPSPEDIEEMIRQFVSITGKDENIARNWLEATCYDLMRAVDMFIEMDQQEKRKEKRAKDGDLAAAVSSCNSDYVRPADPVKRQKLVDYDSTMLGSVPNFDGGILTRPTSHSCGGDGGLSTPNPFRDFVMESRRSTDDGGGYGSSSSGNDNSANTKRAKKLADLFEPPHSILFKGTFQAARKEAKERKLWLLVSLQLDSEFDCLRMNRDTLKDDMLQQVIRASCVFWQPASNTSFSRQYASLYGVNAYPYMAVIDPMTGREIWSKTGFMDTHSLTEAIMDMGEYKDSMETIKNRAISGNVALGVPPQSSHHEEDTELKAAIEASLKDAVQSGTVSQDSEVNVMAATATMDDRIQNSQERSKEKEDVTIRSPCPVKVEPPGDEPEAGGESTTCIRFIFPTERKHITRRFLKTASVRTLYGFVLNVLKADVDNSLEDGSSSGKTGGPILPFDLLRTYPRVSLKDCEDLNVSGAGLENIAIKDEHSTSNDKSPAKGLKYDGCKNSLLYYILIYVKKRPNESLRDISQYSANLESKRDLCSHLFD